MWIVYYLSAYCYLRFSIHDNAMQDTRGEKTSMCYLAVLYCQPLKQDNSTGKTVAQLLWKITNYHYLLCPSSFSQNLPPPHLPSSPSSPLFVTQLIKLVVFACIMFWKYPNGVQKTYYKPQSFSIRYQVCIYFLFVSVLTALGSLIILFCIPIWNFPPTPLPCLSARPTPIYSSQMVKFFMGIQQSLGN